MAPAAALASLEDLLDQIAGDPDADPAERVASLRALRSDLSALTGVCDRYIADQELRRESAAFGRVGSFMDARAEANARGELLDRGEASPEGLDGAGILSHDELDRRIADGSIEEAILGLPLRLEEWTPAALAARQRLHPDWNWSKLVTAPTPEAPEVPEPAAPEVPQPPARSYGGRARELDTRVADAIARGGQASPGTRPAVADTGPVPDVNAPVNPVGRVSQKRLLAYARGALTQPATVDAYAHTGADGKRVYDQSRQAEHQRIINKLLDGIPSQKNPSVLFTGGGYGAGKGGVLKHLDSQGLLPKDALTIDPDKIKAELPEFQHMLKEGDPEANMAVYEEAWDIAKALQAEAQRRKVNTIVDGIGDTSPEDMLARVKSFKDAGYGKATAHYVTTPIDKAVETTMHRATRPGAPAEDRRFIPEPLVRATHRDVAASLPGIIDGSRKPGEGLDEIHVHDTSRPHKGVDAKGERVYAAPPKLFSQVNGKDKVHDEAGWQQALDRANEDIAGVEAPPRADTDAAMEAVRKLGLDKYPDQTEHAKEVLNGARDTQSMHAPQAQASPGTATTGVMYRGGEATQASPGTAEPDLVTDPGVEYDAERKPLHDKIISRELSKVVAGHTDQDGNVHEGLLPADHPVAKKLAGGAVASDLSEDELNTVRKAAYDARGGEAPKFLFLAGGPASGKTTALRTAPELVPDHGLTLSPDEYMEDLPEYQKLHGDGDVYAASAGHEESTDVSKRLQREGELMGLNLVADGVGNSGAAKRDEQGNVTQPGKFAKKLMRANQAGYDVSALTVTVPSNVAAVRSVRRALGDGKNPGNGKLVPIPALEQQHASVSQNYPEIANLPFLKEMRVVDTSGNEPVTIAQGPGGNVQHLDEERMGEFLAKHPDAAGLVQAGKQASQEGEGG